MRAAGGGAASRPEKPTMAAGLAGAAKAHMQRQHGALAEAHQGQPVGAKAQARQFLDPEKRPAAGPPPSTPLLNFMRVHAGEPEPLKAGRRARHPVGRIGRDKGRGGQQRLPMRRPGEIRSLPSAP